ncbi:MAG: FG-GAP repeat protein [Methanosarcinales archaeon]|nr:FG-GAP repeat protein [Methanosarcinales archaeon]
MLRDNRAQLQTLEGFAAALLMVGTVYLVVSAVTLSVPQTELHLDAQLKTYGRDALAILDAQMPPVEEGEYYTSSLKNSVVDWVNGVAGATSFGTAEFAPSNPGTNQTSYRFEFAGPPASTNRSFTVSIPNNTRISHAYVTLTGMPLLDMGTTTTVPPTKYEIGSPSSSSDYFGCAIAHGNVNNDTIPDMVVGAYGNNSSSGVVYVYYGNNSSIVAWATAPDITITNPGASGDCFGWAVACGDVNGDDVSDLIIGAYKNDTTNSTDNGAAYIYYGNTPMGAPNVTMIDPAASMGNDDDWFGYSLACGDLNGDGFDDVIAGAPGVNRGAGASAGKVFIYYGNNSLGTILTTGDVDVALYNPFASNDFFGISVACFDIGGSGTRDAIVGANNSSSVYAYFGGSLPSLIDSIGGVNMTFHGEGNSEFGISVAQADDVNKDGADDLIVGAPGNVSAHIFYGGSLLDNKSDINLTGTTGSRFGISVSASGDADSDGYAGVIVGRSDKKAETFFDVDLGIGSISVSETDVGFGTVVSEIGDVDADGIPDFAVGAPGADAGAGKVYVYTPRFPETPWLAVGNATDLANGNGTKVWEYTTVIKNDDGNRTGNILVSAGNSTDKTLLIYREIATDAILSMYIMTNTPTDVRVSVNGVEVNATSPAINTSGIWEWHNITLPGDITEWRIGNNNIAINVTSGTLSVGRDIAAASMIRVILPITQPFKTSERTTDFAAAINDWLDCHNATSGTYEVPFLLHSDSSGAINVTNLRIEATPSLNENLDMLLPDFVEYNVIFAYLDTLLKGYLYTFSDGSFEKTLNFTGNENHTVHILLPNNTTSVYQANMDVTGLPYEPIEEYALPGISFAQGADTAIVVDSDGNVHIAYSRNNPQLDYITNEGEVWSGSQDINNGGGSTNNISMTIDSDDELHAAFIKGVANPDVYYTRTCDGEWLSSTILVNESDDNEPSYHPSQPCIAVDSGNDAHIVWIENASIYYSENTAGTWSPAVRLNNTINATRPLFDIDSDDIKHIAFLENKTAYYLNTSGGNWGIPVHVGSSTNASDMSMSLDFHGSTHLAWVENGTTLYYSNNTIGSWSYKEMVRNVTIVISEPSLDTDYTGNAYLVWAEADGATSYIYYSTNAAGSWSDPPMQLGGGDAIDPSVCIDIDIHGNIHIIWSEGDELYYYGYALYYPTKPYIIINNNTVWDYNITEINHNNTKIGNISLGDSNTDAIYKNFVIDEEITGPSSLSIYVKGGNGSIDIYVNDAKVRSTFIPANASFIWQNITIPSGAWRIGTNRLRINGSHLNNTYGYAESSDDVNDWYCDNETMNNSFDHTWMIRLYATEYHGTQTLDDFSEPLNAYISSHNASDGYYNITFTVHSDTKGKIKLSRLRIYYYIRGNETHVMQKRIFTNGVPPYNSVTAARLVTVQDADITASDAEERMPDASMSPKIKLWNLVEVRLEMWYK